MKIPDHISESLETIFWDRILKFFDANPDPGSGILVTLDPGWKILGSGIRDKHPESATLPSRKFRLLSKRPHGPSLISKKGNLFFALDLYGLCILFQSEIGLLVASDAAAGRKPASPCG
jgi:hypothetical protein